MTKEEILQKAEEQAQRAKATGIKSPKITLKSGNISSLEKVINTKEKADLFMKMLKVL